MGKIPSIKWCGDRRIRKRDEPTIALYWRNCVDQGTTLQAALPSFSQNPRKDGPPRRKTHLVIFKSPSRKLWCSLRLAREIRRIECSSEAIACSRRVGFHIPIAWAPLLSFGRRFRWSVARRAPASTVGRWERSALPASRSRRTRSCRAKDLASRHHAR